MATLRDIRRRIRSVTNTQQITRAMKMVAAAKLRRAQRSLFALRPYADTLDRLRIEAARRFVGDEHPLLEVRPERRVAVLLMTSDRGLCGSFNHNLVRALVARVADSGAEQVPSIIGLRGARMLRREGLRTAHAWSEMADPANFEQVLGIAQLFIRDFEAGAIDAFDVVYAHFQSPISQPIRMQRLLPIPPLRPDEMGTTPAIVEPWLFEPDTEAVAEGILTRNVAVQLFRALSESQTSEHGARMTSMDNATENADDMIYTLTHQYNVARQQAITRELLDIVTGANAV